MLFAACDLGGTFTRVALIDKTGSIALEMTKPTPLKSAKDVIDGVEGILKELVETAGAQRGDLASIGIGVAGMVDTSTGVVAFAPNLPLRNTPVKKMLNDRFKVPVFVDNDAAAATLGEAKFGAGKGINNLVMLTIGTGIGGGIVIEGELYRGETGSAGEIGHMVIALDGPDCRCGNKGCLEALASGRAIAARARGAVRRAGGKSLIMKLARGDLKAVTGEVVAQAAMDGDATAISVLKETGRIIGVGLTNVVNIFNPKLIILGGGVMEGDKVILAAARAEVKKHALIPNRDTVKIVPSVLGNKAGLLGAAALAFAGGEIG